MNTKHTPGPWYWSNSYPTLDNRATWSLVSEADGYGILSCDGEENAPQGIGNPENARLIAAAPDLLEALEGLCNAYMALPGALPHASADGSWYAHAKAAIAKATGEQA